MSKKRLSAEIVSRLLAVQKSVLLQELQKGAEQMINSIVTIIYIIFLAIGVRFFGLPTEAALTMLVVSMALDISRIRDKQEKQNEN